MTTSAPPAAVASRSKVRRLATVAVGYTLVAGGAVLLVLPGPGVALMLVGLAVVGREQPWARRLEAGIRTRTARLVRRIRPVHSGS
jgi:hypothetical protein